LHAVAKITSIKFASQHCTAPLRYFHRPAYVCKLLEHLILINCQLNGDKTKNEHNKNELKIRKIRGQRISLIRALILFIQTLALYKSFTYLLTYLQDVGGNI